MPTTFSYVVEATSGITDGVTVTANGAAMAVGANVGANGAHAVLRFDSSALVEADTIVSAILTLYSNTAQTPGAGCDFILWGSEFGTAIGISDYNKASYNLSSGRNAGTGAMLDPGVERQQICPVALGAVAIGLNAKLGDFFIPSRFINKAAGGKADFEIRPSIATLPSAGQVLSVCGPTHATAGQRPTLSGVTLTHAELIAPNAYRSQGIGDQSYVAFGQEASEGNPVKARTFLDFTGHSLDANPVNIPSNAMQRNRAKVAKMGVGRTSAGGDVDFEATPERCWQLLLGMLKSTGTTINSPVTGVNETNFQIAKAEEVKTFTFVTANGRMRFVYPGCTIASMRFTAELDNIINVNVSMGALDEWDYDYNAAGGANDDYLILATASGDTEANGLITYIGTLVKIAGEDRGRSVERVTITLSQGAEERRGMTQKRYIDGHVVGGLVCDAEFTMHFTDEEQVRKYFGVNHTDFPFKAEKNIVIEDLRVQFAGSLGCNYQLVEFRLPRFHYLEAQKPVREKGLLKISCRGMGLVSSALNNTNISVLVRNSENHDTVWVAGTVPITVMPAETVTC